MRRPSVKYLSARPGSSVTIRAPGRRDLPSLLRIERRCFTAHRFTEGQFRYYLRNRFAIFAVADSGGRLVGYIAGVVDHRGRVKTARLYSIAVLAEHRHAGIGALLLRCFENEAGQRGCRVITLEVAQRNRTALALYESFGYTGQEVLFDYYGEQQHGIRMRKPLTRKERQECKTRLSY